MAAAAAAAAAAASSSSINSAAEESKYNLQKQVRSYEVAITELNNLSSSRAVYQKNGNIFFRTNIQRAIANEQKHPSIS